MASILIIFFLALLAWFWMDSVRAKEKAMIASAQACQEIQAQFLDQTASLKSLRITRNQGGRMMFQRIYNFDFSRDRETRMKGQVTINGRIVSQVILDDDLGATIL